jgi:hypothetical protein
LKYLARGKVFNDHVLATAILDRLLHHATTLNIKGESYGLREKKKVGSSAARSRRRLRRWLPMPPADQNKRTISSVEKGHLISEICGRPTSALTLTRTRHSKKVEYLTRLGLAP